MPHLRVRGKGGKTRYLPLHTTASDRIHRYLEEAGHADDSKGAMFRPVRNRTPKKDGSAPGSSEPPSLSNPLTADGVYKSVIKHYGAMTGLNVEGFCTHSLRATAATAALDGGADLARVQSWLGHSNISTTRNLRQAEE